MAEKYKYMSADEIADFILGRYKRDNPQFNMEESFKIGRLTDGLDTYDASSEFAKSTNMGLSFFHSLDDKSPEAQQFKEQVLLLTKFFTREFYKNPNAADELTIFMNRGIEIITSVKMRRDFLRGMFHKAPSFFGDKISREIANNPFATSWDVCRVLNIILHMATKQDEIKQYLDRLEKLATAEIISELRKEIPDDKLISQTIQMVNSTCENLAERGYNWAEISEIKEKFTLQNMMNLAKENTSQKPEKPVQDPRDKEIEDLKKLVQTLQNDLEVAKKEKNELQKNRNTLQKEIEELRAHDVTIKKKLSQAATKLKVGIGSRGVKNMKNVVRDIKSNTK